MRICLISPQVGIIGAARSMIETVDALVRRGHEPWVVLPHEGPIVEVLKQRNIDTYILPFTWWVQLNPGKLEWLRMLPHLLIKGIRFVRECRRRNIDLIYTNTMGTPLGAFAASRLGCPHVWHVREFGYEDHGLHYVWGERFSLKWANRLTHFFVSNSEAVARKHEPFFPRSKMEVVYQGVDVAMGEGKAPSRVPGRFRCVMACMLNERKGHLEGIDAVGALMEEGLDIELLIAGASPFPDHLRRLEARIRELDVGDRIQLLGPMDNAVPLIESADLLLMCSRCEAFGRGTAEALLVGTPVVGSRSGGTPELVRDHETGLLYEPGDTADLAKKIRYMAEHPDERAAMGAHAKAWAANTFDAARYQEKMMRIFERTLADVRG